MDGIKKDVYLLKVIISSVLAVSGILTIIFAILGLAKVTQISPDLGIKYIAGIALIVSGVIILTINLAKKPHDVDIRDAILASLVIAFGVLFLLKYEAISSIIIYILPLSLACVGGGLFIRGLIVLLTLKHANEDEKKGSKTRSFFLIFFGAIFVVVGTLLCVFNEQNDLKSVIWLIAGLFISACAFVGLVQSIKGFKELKKDEKKDVKKEHKDKKEEKQIEHKEENKKEEDVKEIENKEEKKDNNNDNDVIDVDSKDPKDN